MQLGYEAQCAAASTSEVQNVHTKLDQLGRALGVLSGFIDELETRTSSVRLGIPRAGMEKAQANQIRPAVCELEQHIEDLISQVARNSQRLVDIRNELRI